jgi:hypothetical protein
LPLGRSSSLWLGSIAGFAKCKERKMNREKSPRVCLVVVLKERKDKLAFLKKAITEDAYKVKVEDIAEKILKARLFELALTLYNHKYQKGRDN